MRHLYRLVAALLWFSLALFPLRTEAEASSSQEIGKRVAILLENRHFSKRSNDDEHNRQIIQRFVRSLEKAHLCFTKDDLREIEAAFSKNLHTRLFDGSYEELVRLVGSKYSARVADRVRFNRAYFSQGWAKIKASPSLAKVAPSEFATNFAELEKVWAIEAKNALVAQVIDYDSSIGPVDPNHEEEFNGLYDKLVLRCLLDDQQVLDESRQFENEDAVSLFLSAFAGSYDAHTDYMNHHQYSRFMELLSAETIETGLSFYRDYEGITRVGTINRSALGDDAALVSINDRLVAIDPFNDGAKWINDLGTLKMEKIDRLFDGSPGSKVALKLLNADGSGVPRVIILTRERVQTTSARVQAMIVESDVPGMAMNRIGIIKLPSFYAASAGSGRSCSDEISTIVELLNREKVEGVVMDLRGNGGGSFSEANLISAIFLKSGPIIQTKDSLGRIQVKMVETNAPKFAGPLVVLTDRNSASASEVFAAAVQDQRRAVIVGQKSTFGKGTIQQTIDLGKEMPLFASRSVAGAVKMTTQMFYRLSGAPIQVTGVESDIVVPDPLDGTQIGEKFLANHLEADRVRPAGQASEPVKERLFLSQLRASSAERVAKSPDLLAIANSAPLKKQTGVEIDPSRDLSELLQSSRAERELAKQQAEESAKRFAEAMKADHERYRFYEVRIDEAVGAQKHPFTLESKVGVDQRASGQAISSVSSLTPNNPHFLDPSKREAFYVLLDLIGLSKGGDSNTPERE